MSNLRLLELKFDRILGSKTEFFPDFEVLKRKVSKKFVISGESGEYPRGIISLLPLHLDATHLNTLVPKMGRGGEESIGLFNGFTYILLL